MREKGLVISLIGPAFIVLFLLTIFPLIYELYASFFSATTTVMSQWRFVGFQNYLQIVRDDLFWTSLSNTLTFVSVAVLIEFLIGLGLALYIYNHQELRGLRIFRSLFLLPIVMMPIIVGLVWRMMYHPTFGVMSYLAKSIFGIDVLWLQNPSTALFSIIIVDVWQWTPFVFLVFFSSIQTIPIHTIEAAKIDGASMRNIIWHVILPAARYAMIVILLLRVVDSFRLFDWIYLMTSGGPGASTEVLSFTVFKWGFTQFNIGKGAALSFIMLIIIVIVSQVFSKVFKFEE